MKKSTKILLCLSTSFIALGAILMVGSLALGVDPVYAFQSGMFDFNAQQKRTSEFSADGQYSVPADGITELSIDWLDGTIEVEVYDGSEIILQEIGSSALNESNSLMYTKEKNTLRIVSAPSQIGVFLSDTRYESKELHIYLPKNAEWNGLQIDAQDANIFINSMNFPNLKVDVVDGDLFLSKVKLENLSFNSVEGNLTVKDAQIEKIKADTTSGGMNASLTNSPQSILFDTLSGKAELYLPDDSEFVLQMDTISGILDSDFMGTYNGKYFTVGAGVAQFKMNTTSGSVQVLKIHGK